MRVGSPAASSCPSAQAQPEAEEVVAGTVVVMEALDVILVHPSLATSTLMALSRRIRLALAARGIVDTGHA